MIIGKMIPGQTSEMASTFQPLGSEEAKSLRPATEEEKQALNQWYKGIRLVTDDYGEYRERAARLFQIPLKEIEESDVFAAAEIMEMLGNPNHRKKLKSKEPRLSEWIERSKDLVLGQAEQV